MEMDIALYDRCAREANEKQRQHENQRANSKQMWESLRVQAAQATVGTEETSVVTNASAAPAPSPPPSTNEEAV
jgi:hypothetical protein